MASKNGSGKKMVVWGILGLLIVGLGGFGTANFGGSISNVGSVGDRDIDVNTYANALTNEISRLEQQIGQQMSIEQAEQIGIPARVLNQLFNQAALDGETARLGLSVGDAAVRSQLLSIPAFQGLDGTFDSDTYRASLNGIGENPSSFEEGLREDLARALLQGALTTGVTMPEIYGDVVVEWIGERRTISVATMGGEALSTGVPVPTEADIKAQYDANPDAYTAPETRNITYVWLTPAMISNEVDLDEASLRQIYDDNIAQFVQAERRLVERLVFGSAEDAAAATARLQAGETTYEDEIIARGLDIIDADMGDVAQSDLGSAGDAVFALEVSGVSDVIMTDIGPAIFRVNGILEASEISFEEARADLSVEMASDAARRDISDMIEDLDDLLASGATLEEVAAETRMEQGQLGWTATSEDGIASYSAFVAAVRAAEVGDFPEIVELSDGGIFAMRLDSVTPATLTPLEDVRDQVVADWEVAETARQMLVRAQDLESQVASGTPLADLGLPVETFETITRQDFISTMPEGFIDVVFEPGLAAGATTLIEGDGRVVIALIDAVLPPEDTADNTAIADSYIASAAQGAAQDVVTAFSSALRTREGISINQTAVDAIHVQLP
ncbi:MULTISPECIES: peptidyl-prolyl cis-trans isomerase [Pacificibacter]|uniref:peptidyl-prolyl cis-trans isomerase n=1 Tax=Pacificibacter TaxID=1042323 RepID=UPI001C093755|nr:MULTISPECIES: peptidyl-prolyl cis-trans isomerase [Pacificibacter]MBU2936212.1 SurA N-terminal domain-containing protein [Pacificibacter marinus]MDO6616795.1 SurA N-terminal domain-containing protein [Pacificibacter sp. 1_MG-2023]